MTNFIPIFPLGIVVYPGENLNLHIFEPRYKQLIQECLAAKKTFGIPVVIDNKVQDHGMLAEITELSQLHENGEMDIKTKGIKVFRLLEVIKEIPDKLYSGAIVSYPQNNEQGSPDIMQQIIKAIKELHQLLKVSKDFKKDEALLTSYDVAHHIGLSLQEEYEMLCLFHERQRQEYLRFHLAKVIPVLLDMEKLKEKIKLNGHFKNLSGFDL
jgi:Lon protease-like protein